MKKYFLTAICMASCAFAFADGEDKDENTSCESSCEARWVCVDEEQYNEQIKEAALAYLGAPFFQNCGPNCDCDGDVCVPPKDDN